MSVLHWAGYCSFNYKAALRWLTLLPVFLSLTACSFSLRMGDEGTSGVVIDQETGKPLEGAIIAAYWMTEEGSLAGGSRPVEYVHFFETVTDVKGQFVVPAWKADRIFISGNITPRFTQLLVFKPGYKLVQWQGETIKHWRPVATESMKDLGADVARDAVNNALVVRGVQRGEIDSNTAISLSVEQLKSKSEFLRNMRNLAAWLPLGDPAECRWRYFSSFSTTYRTELLRQQRDSDRENGRVFQLPRPGDWSSPLDGAFVFRQKNETPTFKTTCPDPLPYIKKSEELL
jgi:hypothetical protein